MDEKINSDSQINPLLEHREKYRELPNIPRRFYGLVRHPDLQFSQKDLNLLLELVRVCQKRSHAWKNFSKSHSGRILAPRRTPWQILALFIRQQIHRGVFDVQTLQVQQEIFSIVPKKYKNWKLPFLIDLVTILQSRRSVGEHGDWNQFVDNRFCNEPFHDPTRHSRETLLTFLNLMPDFDEFFKREKSNYSDYLSEEEIQKGLESGEMKEGVLVKHRRKSAKSFVSVDDMEQDIVIDGFNHLNRAFLGDRVIVRLLGQSELDHRKAISYIDSDQKENTEESSEMKSSKPPKRSNVRWIGEIVSITDNSRRPKVFTGTVPKTQFKNLLFFCPRSENFPQASVFRPLLPRNHQNIMFSVKYGDWPPNKRHPAVAAEGVTVLGEISDEPDKILDVELKAVLAQAEIQDLQPEQIETVQNDIYSRFGEFLDKKVEGKEKDAETKETYSCRVIDTFRIPEEEFLARKDFRSKLICTIDPKGSRDADDAISIEEVGGGYLIGVHIADVSHFVKPGTGTDDEAYSRGISYYLPKKCYAMLPDVLCHQLCSLNPGVDRFAVSVFWKITANFDLVDEPPSITRSVIHSCCKLTYAEAQQLVEGKSVDIEIEGHSVEELRQNLQLLTSFSEAARSRRGSRVANDKDITFDCDEKGVPVAYHIQERFGSHRMIEELMVHCNMLVAEVLIHSDQLKGKALLRRHPQPDQGDLLDFQSYCHEIGAPIELKESNQSLVEDAFDSYLENHTPPAPMPRCKSWNIRFTDTECIRTECNENMKTTDYETLKANLLHALHLENRKSMKRAEIYADSLHDNLLENSSSEQESDLSSHRGHYGLGLESYTHFTSPIRRYCDLVVHRQLLKTIGASKKDEEETRQISEVAAHYNERMMRAQRIEDSCSYLYMGVLALKRKELHEVGIVTRLDNKHLVIYVSALKLERHLRLTSDFATSDLQKFSFTTPETTTERVYGVQRKQRNERKNDVEESEEVIETEAEQCNNGTLMLNWKDCNQQVVCFSNVEVELTVRKRDKVTKPTQLMVKLCSPTTVLIQS